MINSILFERELKTAIRVIKQAGEISLKYFYGKYAVSEKSDDKELVTTADVEINKLIATELQNVFPRDLIIGEEYSIIEAPTNSDRIWFIDPIDATSQFIKGTSEWSILIGLALNGEPCLGVVFQPVKKKLYFAALDTLAYLEKDDGVFGLKFTNVNCAKNIRNLQAATVVLSMDEPKSGILELTKKLGIFNHYHYRSIGLKLVHVAEGRADIYFNLDKRTKLWDLCASHAILLRAGGDINTFKGQRIDYNYKMHIISEPYFGHTNVIRDPLLSALDKLNL